jgi:hypothetical protein
MGSRDYNMVTMDTVCTSVTNVTTESHTNTMATLRPRFYELICNKGEHNHHDIARIIESPLISN